MKVLVAIILSFVMILTAGCESDTQVLICKGKSSYAYHSHQCKGLNQCRASIIRVEQSEAQSMGRKPCGYCYGTNTAAPPPPPSTSSSSPPPVKEYQSTSGGQCTAITKKGSRCSRRARSSGRCWQHGG